MNSDQLTGRYFDTFQIGQEFITSTRTVTEADIVFFAGLSGDYNPMHTDEEYARKSIFGERIAHGLLIVAVISGFLFRLGLTLVSTAILGTTWQFVKAIKIGDTIYAKVVVSNKRESKSKPENGIITFDITVYNQKDEITQKGQLTVLVPRK